MTICDLLNPLHHLRKKAEEKIERSIADKKLYYKDLPHFLHDYRSLPLETQIEDIKTFVDFYNKGMKYYNWKLQPPYTEVVRMELEQKGIYPPTFSKEGNPHFGPIILTISMPHDYVSCLSCWGMVKTDLVVSGKAWLDYNRQNKTNSRPFYPSSDHSAKTL